jgi:hypothetical protein
MSSMTGWRENVAGLTEQNRRPWQQGNGPWLHWIAAAGEGLCPDCCRPLDPVTMPGCDVAGHCVPCGRYWYTDYASREAGFVPDRNPDGSPRPPERP